MVKNRKAKSIVAGALAATLLLGSTMAYFTDHAEMQADGTAGTLDIETVSHINLLDLEGNNILNPGDLRNAGFEVSNIGNKSTDIKTVLTLTSDVAMTKTGQAEYELYNRSDVTFVEGVGAIPVVFEDNFSYKGLSDQDAMIAYSKDYVKGSVEEGEIVGTVIESSPLTDRVISEDGKTITYNVPDRILNGNMSLDKYEDEGVGSDKTFYDYVLVMNSNANNSFQDSTVSIKVNIYAKQHRNNDNWELVSSDFTSNGEQSTYKRLDPGLYDGNDVMLMSWEELDINIEEDISLMGTFAASTSSEDVAKLVIPEGTTRIGDYQLDALASNYSNFIVDVPTSVASVGDTELKNLNIEYQGTEAGLAGINFDDPSILDNSEILLLNNDLVSAELLEPGLYSGSGELIFTWEELEEKYGITKEEVERNYSNIGINYGRYVHLYEDGVEKTGDKNIRLVLPEGIERIGDYNMYYKKPSIYPETENVGEFSVDLPSSIKSLGNNAFAITGINYHGTETEWNAISFDNGWDPVQDDNCIISFIHEEYDICSCGWEKDF